MAGLVEGVVAQDPQAQRAGEEADGGPEPADHPGAADDAGDADADLGTPSFTH